MKITIKNSLKVLSLCALLYLGSKDTGTIINNTNVKNDNNSITLSEGMKVDIIRENLEKYIVSLNGQNYEVNKNDLIVTERKSSYYAANKITALLEDISSSNVKRFLLENEEVTVQDIKDNYAFVLTRDNMTGYVLLSDLDTENLVSHTVGILKMDVPLSDGTLMKQGTLIEIISYDNGCFVCVDMNGKNIIIPKDTIKISESDVNRSLETRNIIEKVVDKSNIIETAMQFIGTPYSFGSNGPKSFDCSGFSRYIFKLLGYNIPRSSSSQSNYGEIVSRENLQIGDLVFFNTSGKGVSHVGVYIGEGRFIHAASNPVNKVTINSLNEKYYSQRYVNARRVLK